MCFFLFKQFECEMEIMCRYSDFYKKQMFCLPEAVVCSYFSTEVSLVLKINVVCLQNLNISVQFLKKGFPEFHLSNQKIIYIFEDVLITGAIK